MCSLKSASIKDTMQNKTSFFTGQYEVGHRKRFFLFNLGRVVFVTEIAEIEPGEFPIIDVWHPLPLEIPESGSKGNMCGRSVGPLCSYMTHVEWDKSRIIKLPIFKNTQRYKQEAVKTVKALKEFPYGVPVITLATRYDGFYCEQRRAQAVTVFSVWVDDTSILLELDWCEGPMEDCSNPEWHLRASQPCQIEDGLDNLRKSCRNRPIWENCTFYLYVIPPFLGNYLLGRGKEFSNKVWQREWRYTQHGEMLGALNQIINSVWGQSEEGLIVGKDSKR